MATVDDIEVDGASSVNEIADLISSLIGVPVSIGADNTRYLRIDDQTQITMYDDDDHPGRWIAEVQRTGTDEDQLAIARSIYDHLAEQTSWNLTLTSDREPEYVVASRTRARA